MGAFGTNFSNRPMRTKVATATARVASEASGACVAIETTSRKKPSLWMWMPRSFGTWSTTITKPMPALNPVSTGSEMKLATKPSRKSRATSRIAPTRTASVAVAVTALVPGCVASRPPSAVAPRIAIVVVVLTLSMREVPRSAYTTIGRKAVYRPTCSGSPAMLA